MTTSAVQNDSTLAPEPAVQAEADKALRDPLSSLAQLRSMLGAWGASAGAGAPHSPELILSAFEQIVAEHRGMADELINAYEQLGIIFEVTRNLSTVRDGEEDVLGLFISSLRRSFVGRDVLIARRARDQYWYCAHPMLREDDRVLRCSICTALRTVCRSERARTVVVHLGEPGDAVQADALIGPVYSGDELVCALVIVRRGAVASAVGGPAFQASDMSLVESLATFCGDVIRNHRLVREMREMSIAMVRALVSAVDQKDQYTCGHSLRVGYYATTLGRLLHLPEAQLQMLQWAALLHDVGKIGIRDSVLNKHGKLTPEEFEHIKEHPVRSHRVVQQIPQLAGALDGILHHHERYDGSGYPLGLKGEGIPMQARIIQIADIFDALTSSRSYRPAYDWPKALGILQEEAGKSVDPVLQQLFDRHMRQAMAQGPQAWTQMIEKANHFASAFGEREHASGGTALPIVKAHGEKP